MSRTYSTVRLPEGFVRARLSSLRISPQKLNLLAQMIRGKNVSVALRELAFSPKAVANTVKKVLSSAIANAENNHGMDVDALYIHEAYVGKEFVLKRFHARAKGRGVQILKPFSQITIVLTEKLEDGDNKKPKFGKQVKADSKAVKQGKEPVNVKSEKKEVKKEEVEEKKATKQPSPKKPIKKDSKTMKSDKV